ncbi:Uncharacterised protein [Staphylococcus aureus]|nr:Uncharacterised protein [Staphylococcus aureus]CAC7154682.1 Uncharacterised protein [Staphylococcus aureus]
MAIIRILSPALTTPSTILIDEITPLYGSYSESNINAFSGASGSPSGAGTTSTIFSSISSIPMLDLALAKTTSSWSKPIISSISCFTRSGSAAGKSILLITGNNSNSLSNAK